MSETPIEQQRRIRLHNIAELKRQRLDRIKPPPAPDGKAVRAHRRIERHENSGPLAVSLLDLENSATDE